MAKPKRYPQVVCKPCWELKYCPYGYLVEFFPLNPSSRSIDKVKESYDQIISNFANGHYKTEDDILSAVESLQFNLPLNWEEMQECDVSDLECKEFGHICPVFFHFDLNVTETKVLRKRGRYIPRDIMLKVVRRDGQICQLCHKYVPDTELEFDHLIPHSKGGQISVDNLRVLCRECNAGKRDYIDELLNDYPG